MFNLNFRIFERAQITTSNGALANRFSHLSDLIKSSDNGQVMCSNATAKKSRKILLLGNGLVSMPVIDYFEKVAKTTKIQMTVVGMSPSLSIGAQSSGSTFEKQENFSITYLQSDFLNSSGIEELKRLIPTHDIVIRYGEI